MNPRGLVPLFATAIQNATAISNEMRALDLQSAFKMTCELQQHIVDVIFARRRQLTAAVLQTFKPEPDTETFPLPNTTEDSREQRLCEDGTTSTWETRANSSELSDTGAENKDGQNRNETAEKPADAYPNAVVTDPSCDHSLDRPPLSESQLTNGGTPEEEAVQRRHRLVALETLQADCLMNSGETLHYAPCASCHLRVKPGYEAMAVMACAACPEQPAICSAQCFRWWHSRSRTNVEPRVLSVSSSIGAVIPNESLQYCDMDSRIDKNSSFDPARPVVKQSPLRRVHTKHYNWSRCKYRKPARRTRHQTIRLKKLQPMSRSEELPQTRPQYSRHGRRRKLTLKYSPIIHVTNFSRKRRRLSENSST